MDPISRRKTYLQHARRLHFIGADMEDVANEAYVLFLEDQRKGVAERGNSNYVIDAIRNIYGHNRTGYDRRIGHVMRNCANFKDVMLFGKGFFVEMNTDRMDLGWLVGRLLGRSQLVTMLYLCGYVDSEVGKMIGTNDSRVIQILQQVRSKLRKMYERGERH